MHSAQINIIYRGIFLITWLLALAWLGYTAYIASMVAELNQNWDHRISQQHHLLQTLEKLESQGGIYGISETLHTLQHTADPELETDILEKIKITQVDLQQLQQLSLLSVQQRALDKLHEGLSGLEQLLGSSPAPAASDLMREKAKLESSLHALEDSILQGYGEADKLHQQSVRTLEGLIWKGVAWVPLVLLVLGFSGQLLKRIKRSRQDLESSRQTLENLLQATPDATLVVNEQGLVEYANQAAQKLFGYHREAFVGLELRQLIPEELRCIHNEMHEQYFKPEAEQHIGVCSGLQALHHDGHTLQVDVSLNMMERDGQCLALASVRDVGGRMEAEERLRTSEERFRSLFNNSSAGMAIIGLDGVPTMVNPAFQKMLGYTEAEMKAMHFNDFTHPEDVEDSLRQYSSIINDGQEYCRLHKRYIHKDGHVVWGSLGASAIRDGEGRLLHIVATVEDISELKQKEQALMEADTKHSTFFNLAPDGIVIVEPETSRISDCNDQAAAQLGYTREEFIGLTIQDFEAVEDPEDTERHVKNIMEHGRDDFETLQRRKNGEIRNVFVTVQLIFLQGQPVLYCIFRDVTDLRSLSERLEMAARAGSIGVWDWDLVTDRTTWGTTMYPLFGVDEGGNAHPPEWMEFIHPDDKAQVQGRLFDALEGRREFDTECRIVTASGHLRYLKSCASVVRNLRGDAIRMVGASWDITDMELAQQAADEARFAAEEANQAKSDFLANMSHEIRTPMSAIIGLTQLLQSTPLNDTQQDYLDKVQVSSRSLLNILNDILDYSKIEAGRMEIERAPFELEEVLSQIASLFSASLEQKGIDLIFHVSNDVPQSLVGDALRISQVLINLVSNSLKFTEHGQVVLQVQSRQVYGDEAVLLFSVRDTGQGIEEQEQARLFEAFSQGDTSTTRRYGGTGLGLAISQRLVEMMGGKMEVESQPGVGSTFSFSCPLGVAHQQEAYNYFVDMELSALIVEHNDEARQSLCELIGGWHFKVNLADGSEQAIERLLEMDIHNRGVDLLVLDSKLPGQNGLDLLERIELMVQQGVIQHKPRTVILVGTHFDEGYKVLENEQRAVLLNKPVTPSTLYDVVVNLHKGRQSGLVTAQSDFEALAQPIRGSRILLVEDNIINQQVASELLSQVGMEVMVANNGEEAMSLLEIQDFDIILMDLQMPEMDGFEATRRIRGKNVDIPILAMTAAAMKQDRERCLEVGMSDHIAKPIEPVAMIKALRRWLPQTHVQAETEFTATNTVQNSPVQALPAIKGVNSAKGIANLRGREELFQSLLLQFHEEYQGIVEELGALADSGDNEALASKIHTLKGVSGAIAAESIMASCTQLEEQLRGGENADPDELSRLLNNLNALQQSLYQYKQAHQAGSADEHPGLPDRIKSLRNSLKANELVESADLNELECQLADNVDRKVLDSLIYEIGQFNYEKAVGLVDELEQQFQAGRVEGEQ